MLTISFINVSSIVLVRFGACSSVVYFSLHEILVKNGSPLKNITYVEIMTFLFNSSHFMGTSL